MYLYVYVVVLAGMLLFMMISRKESLYSDREVPGVLRPVRRAAVGAYRRIRGLYSRFGEGRVHPWDSAVEKDLSLLDPSKGLQRKVAIYYIDKLQNLMLFMIAADLLAISVWYSERQASVMSEEGTIARPEYGESDLEVLLEVSVGDDGVERTYTLNVEARQYTWEETQEMAEELMELLPELILGENESISNVTGDLNLISSAEDYPFRIRWYSSRYEWIDSDGNVQSDQIEEGDTVEVTLTAKLTYGEWSFERDYEVILCPVLLSEEEQLDKDIQEVLERSAEESAEEADYHLPEEINGVPLFWEEVTEDSSLPLFGLILAAGAAVYLFSDRDLHDKVRVRERQLSVDYPQIVSKLVLFLGAGMSTRNAFARLGEIYMKSREEGGEKRYVYEEILLVCRELDSGISESTALSHFGRRCGTRQYTRLCSLLMQNMKKGNQELLTVLQAEADLAFEERRSLARQMGEEAGTRLLLPMMLMLGVTLIIIMIPAYMSFT